MLVCPEGTSLSSDRVRDRKETTCTTVLIDLETPVVTDLRTQTSSSTCKRFRRGHLTNPQERAMDGGSGSKDRGVGLTFLDG